MLYTKIKSKQVKIFKESEATKLPEENIGSKLLDTGLGDDFLNLTPKAKIHPWDYIKLKKLLHSKRNNKPNEKATDRV